MSTGGGGVGGQGGDIDDSGSGSQITAPGGGVSPNSTANSSTSALDWVISSSDQKEDIANPLLLFGSNISGGASTIGAYGSGSSGRYNTSGGLVRDFGGTGGSANTASSISAAYGGGAGGASARVNTAHSPGSGGTGIIIVQILEVYL
jgi:hypothetical protein